ncbi:hypothetical protein VCR81_19450, partial [Acinetobacter baumannii]|uniref:hypothetical protein n=1 Tax=Acinetobacter baumannii TaxID=470 RepID=UPI002FF4386A
INCSHVFPFNPEVFMLPTGNHPKSKAKNLISRSPIKKEGSDMHKKMTSVTILSNNEYWNFAEKTPAKVAIIQLNIKAKIAIKKEFHT